ncbi:MAG: hypothetical protein GY859_21355, partial [Desulfobacterales bacterium]|nr:hypothetical protein [Desulfobacterales bacterium]
MNRMGTLLLPSCSPGFFAEIIDKTPNRLRKKLDLDPAAAKAWEWKQEEDGWKIRVNDETSVTLKPAGGVIQRVDQVECSCLLFPRCFHLMAVLDHLPIAAETIGEPDKSAEGDNKPGEEKTPARDDATALSPEQSTCASRCFEVGATLLHMGAGSAGAVPRVDLLRAIHAARRAGLHRLAASGLRLLKLLKEHRAGDSGFSLSDLREEMNEFLATAALLERGKDACDAGLIGTARGVFRPSGNFFLYGIASEAVISRKGMVGVVTHLMDADHHLYSLASILPEEMQDIENAYNGGVDLGDLVCSHRELVRRGVHVHGARVSDDGRLGRGKKVNAVLARENSWNSDFFRGLFEIPPRDQLDKFFKNREEKRFTPFCFTAVVAGSFNGNPVVAGTAAGARITLLPPSDRHETARRNLSLLSSYKGL